MIMFIIPIFIFLCWGINHYYFNTINHYKETISEAENIICDGMVSGNGSFHISQDSATQLKEYLCNADWEKIQLEEDINPYEYISFDKLVIGIIKKNDNKLLIKILGRSIFLLNGDTINIDTLLEDQNQTRHEFTDVIKQNI